MAKVKRNVIIKGLSGRIGNLVFKQYGDKTVVSQRPEHDPNRRPTPGEARQRGRIKDAAAIAKSILATEEGKVYYQAARIRLGKHSAYHTAIYDFFGAPEIRTVKLGADNSLLIQVSDNVGIREVRIEIEGETGFAAPLNESADSLWRFQISELDDREILIRAKDWMGNYVRWEGVTTDLLAE
ncbi:MAG: hypothetical protein ISR59_12995 [Anaerolineales bacterium]|uniref:Uncharacterized protein n=1 Tax=Candidatus Desulfolinea nitratireducens TaxID=2841698 RepID=A0A8J6TE19_9CHLR|nr:hypothetical protein [Candidatus Desulfolinea nitratireducens]MBL6962017.1 hypothetical protein [Anaerolineales bacterium]